MSRHPDAAWSSEDDTPIILDDPEDAEIIAACVALVAEHNAILAADKLAS